MPQAFNPYSAAISAIEKGIATRRKKLDEQKELETLSCDWTARMELMMEIGRTEVDLSISTGATKKEVEKYLNELNKKHKRIDDAFSEKSTDLMFKRENEINELNSALRELKRLFNRW